MALSLARFVCWVESNESGWCYLCFGGMGGEQNQMLTKLNVLVYEVGVVFVCVAFTVNWAYQLLWGKSLWSDHGLNRDG